MSATDKALRHIILKPFNNAILTATEKRISVHFSDGHSNQLWFDGVDSEEYRAIARWAGYGEDWRRYAVEHDVVHCWLSDYLGEPWCDCLYSPSGLDVESDAPRAHKDREHIVNRLQRWIRTGEPDEYGVVQRMGLDRQIDVLGGALDDLWLTN